MSKSEERLQRQFDELQSMLPSRLAGIVQWLRRPSAWLVRIPLGILLIVGGIFSFLPILGVWMLPLGLLLLALDLPFLQGPVVNGIEWSRQKLRQFREWRANRRQRR
ncbi:MAG: hypothetical protein JWN11_480 [Hyphomicrobiales bacterium]|nr:hypothetical protein [Hyphomicrobiales bacterium]